MKLSLIVEMSPGRKVLGAAHFNEGRTPELLLTSQVRKSWDTLHSSEARCFSPSLLAREQAKELIINQQWLWLPPCPTGTVPCATLHCAQPMVHHRCLCKRQDLSCESVSSLYQVPSSTQKTAFCLRKTLISKSLPLLGFEHCSEL